jgi:MoaA/NifB/PqqE/SkfB family radical SAM enzyme
LHLKDNYKKLIDSGVNEIQISIDGADKETFEKIRVGSVFELVVENCKLINAYAKERGLVTSKYSSKHGSTLCPWPFERAYVSSDARIVPCCIIGNPEAMDLGDAKNLKALWHGEEMRKFRRDQIEGRIPEVCKTCYEKDS